MDIFLSYAREDRKSAKRLAEALTRARGWSVWWDAELRTGERFDRRIERVVSGARCVVVLWSAHSVESDWVVAEVTEGWERGVLVPVLIDDCEPPMPFRQIQAADFIGWTGASSSGAFLQLVEDIQRVMARGSAVSPEELAARETRRRQMRLRRLRRYAVAGIILAVLVAVTAAGLRLRGNAAAADAIAARSADVRAELLSAHDASNKTWWSFVFHHRNNARALEVSGLLAVEAAAMANTARTRAALADAWSLQPWTDKGQSFDWDDWHSSLDFSHDGRLLAGGGGDSGTVVWDVFADEIVARIPHGGLPPEEQRTSKAGNRGSGVLDFSPVEALLATAGPDATARLWTPRGEEVRRFTHEAPVTNLQFSPSGELLAVTDEAGGVVLWNVRSGATVHRMKHGARADGPVFSDRGTYLGTVSADGTATVWAVSTGKAVAAFEHEVDWRGSTVDGIAFSPDESIAVTYGDGLPTVFHDIAGASEAWRDPDGSFAGVVYNADGSVVVIGAVDLAWWDARTGEQQFSIASGVIGAITVSADRRLVGTANSGDTVQVWDMATGTELKRIPTYRWQPSLAFAPDSRTLALGGLDEFRDGRVLEIIDLRPADLPRAVCAGISANFSRNEWREYFPDQPYRATCPGLEPLEPLE